MQTRIHSIALVVIALFTMGCSDDAGPSTTVPEDTAITSAEDVVFGSGTLPETIPENFPLPQGSSVGSTMVVTKSGFTEAIIRIGADIGLTAEFFAQALEQAGFTVASSAAVDDGGWLIEFADGESPGTIELTEPLEGISQAVLRFNVP